MRILLCLSVSACFTGCGNQKVEQEKSSQTAAIANPWSKWDSMEEAEAAAGFSFGMPEVISDRYTAAVFRTLNNELIEVIYRHENFEVCVRKQKGEGEDISGDYNKYDTCTEQDFNGGRIINYYNSDDNAAKQVISYKGYSWSLVAPKGYEGDSNSDFLDKILEAS
jgi:hypothetical protein